MKRKHNYVNMLSILFFTLFLSLQGMLVAQNQTVVNTDRSTYFDGTQIPNGGNRVRSFTPRNNQNITRAIVNRMNQLGARGGTININAMQKTDVIIDNLELRSKIRLRFSPNIRIRPAAANKGERSFIFLLGRDSDISDVQITSQSERFQINFDDFKLEAGDGPEDLRGVRPFNVIRCSNFYIGNFHVVSGQTIFSNVELNMRNPNQNSRRNGLDFPYQGIVENISSVGNHSGFGLVQLRAGKRIYFANLDGNGGITLRAESDFIRGVSSRSATIDQIYGTNIISRRGDAAVVLSPHRINQGTIVVDNIISKNSTWAIQLAAGYESRTGTGTAATNRGLFAPTSRLSVTEWSPNVTGDRLTQVKAKDVVYYLCEAAKARNSEFDDNTILNLDKESVPGRSINIARYFPLTDNSRPKNQRNRFNQYPVVLRGVSDDSRTRARTDCPGLVLRNSTALVANRIDERIDIDGFASNVSVLSPNPASNIVIIHKDQFISAAVYSINGNKVLETDTNTISVSDLNAGVYFVQIYTASGNFVERLMVR